MEDFNDFFERELNERRNKIFNTKKKLKKLILGENQQDNEENAGTAIRNSGDSVEDITKRNMLESRDIPLEKILVVNLVDRKSGTLKVFPIKNKDGDIEYVLLDGTHRYICYKYLYKLDVPADILKDSMEEWEWFYIAGGGNVISSTHVPMDIYSKIKLIGEIMEKKIDGKALKANDAKPIIQKNVPGFQDKCSKEIINAYNRMYKSYKRKYLDMIQQVVMKKDAKQHSMVKDNLELPSLMLLEDSKFKEELFQKMGEIKMSKNDLIIQINKHKFIKFVKNQLEDDNQKENIIEKIERGKYDKSLIEEDSFIREGQLQDTKLWRKLQKLATQEDDSTRKKAESDDIDREGSAYDNSMGQNLIITPTTKRKSDTAWESNIAKKRKGNHSETYVVNQEAQSNSNDHGNTIEGPLRFNIPCELSIPSRRESQFMLINGEIYLSLTFLEYDKYKLLKTLCRAKLINTSMDIHNTTRLSIIDPNSIHIDGDNDEEAIALTPDNNGLEDDAFDFASNNSDKVNNNNQKISSPEQSTIVSNKNNDSSREKSEKKSKDKRRKKDKDKRRKKEKKDKKHKSKEKKQQKSTRTLEEVGLRVPEKEDTKNVQEKPDDEYPDNLSGVERMERDVGSNEENHFDNDDDDDEADQASESAQNEDIESEIISNNNRISNEDNDDNQAGNITLISQINSHRNRIKGIFLGRTSTPRLKQWKSGERDFSRHSGGFTALELKTIFGMLNQWSKDFNQVNPKFDDDEELSQFVVDVLWYELAYRLLKDRHGILHREAKERLEGSPELKNFE